MSLQFSADGLLQTHVTWGEVEKKMQEVLKTTATFGKNKSVVHVGEGNGVLSRIGLITCDWEGATDGEVLPKQFALKMASCLQLKKMSDDTPEHAKSDPETVKMMMNFFEGFIKDTHNTEVLACEFINKFGSRVAIPHCFYTVPFTEENKLAGSIALDYVDNTKICHVHETLSVDQMKQVAREIGKMQALSVIHGVENEEWLSKKDVYTTFWKFFYTSVGLEKEFSQLKSMDASVTESVDAVLKLIPEYHGSNLPITLHKQFGVKPVLVNGDLWSANVLIDKDTEQVRGLIDWQLVHHGTGVEDLIRIALAGMNSSDRRAHMEELLEVMYDSMVETLQGAPVPYTREQMHELYEIVLPHAGFFLAPIIIPLFMAAAAVGALAEEDKTKMKNAVVDKIRGIFEDVVIFHKKNENKQKFVWKSADFAPKV